jgi:hypothetical protein
MSSEQMQRAAYTIDSAAETFRRAAGTLEESITRLERLLDPAYGGTLSRLVEVLERTDQIDREYLKDLEPPIQEPEPLPTLEFCKGAECDVCKGSGLFQNRKCDGIPF